MNLSYLKKLLNLSNQLIDKITAGDFFETKKLILIK
jgi:hypothetical protein